MASAGIKIIADNRRARHEYELSDFVEAGVQLQGTEVKSLRNGKANLGDSYCHINREMEVYLVECHISPYASGNRFNHKPLRERKLLLHKKEILRLWHKVREKGLTIVPTKMYFKNGRVKLEIALGKGKKLHDKRETLKAQEFKREADRVMKDYR